MHGGGEDEAGTMSTDTWLWHDGSTLLETPTARNCRGNAPQWPSIRSARSSSSSAGSTGPAGRSPQLDVWELDANGWHEVLAPS